MNLEFYIYKKKKELKSISRGLRLFFVMNTYLNSNVSKTSVIIAKMGLEVGEVLASGSHTQAVVLVAFENSPKSKRTTKLSKATLIQNSQN